uniref:Protein artemis n=1 Tax=Aegilops tauschii TaxID=37682 RepID=R7W794_AEGTA
MGFSKPTENVRLALQCDLQRSGATDKGSNPASARNVLKKVLWKYRHHAPEGSLMFLFRGDLGCKLYTGDFRWELGCDKARTAKKALLDALAGDTVDVLYLDNTYCHPSLNFPPRRVVAQQEDYTLCCGSLRKTILRMPWRPDPILAAKSPEWADALLYAIFGVHPLVSIATIVDLIRAHPDHEVILGIDTLGKEDLLLYIARALQTKIWVWPQRLLTMHLLGIDDNREIFTTQTSLTRVRAVPRYGLSIESLEALNTVCPTIGIMPSGNTWLWRNSAGKSKLSGKGPAKSTRCKGRGRGAVGTIEMNYDPSSPPKLFEKDSYTLPYTDHACFTELEDFMQTVRPSTVVGIVSSSYCYVNPRGHFGHLCGDEACSDKTPVKNCGHAGNWTPVKNGRHAGNSTPKRRPSASKTPRRRMVKISSPTLYRSRAIMMKRRYSCGAKIVEPEEPIPVS